MSEYINGSDFLLSIIGKCVGHCTEHVVNYTSLTKDRAVKAPESVTVNNSLFKETSVTGLEITISFKGLRSYDEEETSFDAIRQAWKHGTPVTGECFARKKLPALGGLQEGAPSVNTRSPYLAGKFVITKLTENNPADDDASYDGELKLTGAPTTWFVPDDDD